MLPKHLDEKVARLHLDALGVKLTKLTPGAGRVHRRPGRGPVQAGPLSLLERPAERPPRRRRPRPGRGRRRADRVGGGADAGAALDPRAVRARAAVRRPARRRLPARHDRDGEPRAHADRGRGARSRCAPPTRSTRRTTSRPRSSSATAQPSTRSTARTWRPTTATSRRCSTREPQLTMDDGADLVSTLHASRTELLDGDRSAAPRRRRAASCACARSRRPASSASPSWRSTTRARSALFDNRYGTGQSALDGILRATNMLLAGRVVVVVRLRLVRAGDRAAREGRRRARRRLRGRPGARAGGEAGGLRGAAGVAAAAKGDVLITATGNRDVMRREHFERDARRRRALQRRPLRRRVRPRRAARAGGRAPRRCARTWSSTCSPTAAASTCWPRAAS